MKNTELTKGELLEIYYKMVLLRNFEQSVQKLYKTGEIPGFIHLYIGEEATAVGVCAHLRSDDWITSTHRGHGHALAKGVPAKQVLAELYGKRTGCCGGRGGSMHLYAPEHGLFGTNGLVGAGIPGATGLGMSATIRGTEQIAVSFFGDGAVNHGSFHEAVNFAATQNAPVVFICENNLYATSTPLSMSTRNTNISSRAQTYGIPGVAVDGNDVLAVWRVAQEATQRARSGGGPTLIESKTYRFVGHHEGDSHIGTYRTKEELDEWLTRCPLRHFTSYLIEREIVTAEEQTEIGEKIDAELREAVEYARSSPAPDPASARLHSWADPINPPLPPQSKSNTEYVTQGWLEAVRDGIAEEMRRDPHIVYMGEGVGERGGSFGHTKNLWHEFGARRLIDTPICELGLTGAGIGLAATGCRAVADLMFTDFLFDAGSQIIHQAGKLRYMSNNQISVPLIIRSMNGTLKSAGPQHCGNYYPVFAHCPGLIIVVPSTPADAKGLFKTALRASDPVLFLEHKALLSTKGRVPVGEHFVPFGQAAVRREGKDLTVVSCSLMVHRCMEAAKLLETQAISCEVIDLRTIVPLDIQTIAESLSKTGRLLIVDEAFSMCGLGAEIAASMMEEVFDALDAPIGRLHIDPVPSPFSPVLENAVLPTVDKIVAAMHSIMAGIAPKQVRPGTACENAKANQSGSMIFDDDGADTDENRQEPDPTVSGHLAASSKVQGVALKVPNQDLTVTEATIIRWLKKVGDPVKMGEVVIEVETDKALVEVEAELDGVLAEILAEPGMTVALNQQLGTIQRRET